MKTLALVRESYHIALNEWVKFDLPNYVFMTKILIASLLSMSICMAGNLSMPQMSIFTVFIVIQPQSGLVYSKSFYRIVGTLLGTTMAFILMGAFAQDRVSFTIFFALWVGLCTAAGFISRNFMSYGFVNAGYTIALIVMPTIETPLQFYEFAIDRTIEVLIGILCASIVSEVLFPQSLSSILNRNEQNRFKIALSVFGDFSNILDSGKNVVNYSKDILGSDALLSNSTFETGVNKTDKLYFQRLNSEFMHFSTTYFSLKNMIQNIEDEKLLLSIENIYNSVKIDMFETQGVEKKDVQIVENRLSYLKKELIASIEKEKVQLTDTALKSSYESIVLLIVRLFNEFSIYIKTYHSFLTKEKDTKVYEKFTQTMKFSSYNDKVLVLLSMLKGSLTLVLAMCFWIITGWKYAPYMIIPAVANTVLLATVPDPVAATKEFLKGSILGIFLTFFFNYLYIPVVASDYYTYIIAIIPVILYLAWLTAKGRQLFAFGIILIYINACAMGLQYHVSFNFYAGIVLSTILGLLISATAFLTINSWSISWVENRVRKILSSTLVSLTKDKLSLQRVKLESSGFDLIQRFSILGKLDSQSNYKIFRWLLSTLEIGKAIINIRQSLDEFKEQKPKSINRIIILLRRYFDLENKQDKEKQMQRFTKLFESLKQNQFDSSSQQVLMNNIYKEVSLIYAIMQNKELLPIKGEL